MDTTQAVANGVRGTAELAGGAATPKAVPGLLAASKALGTFADKLAGKSDIATGVQVGAQIADGDVRGATQTVGEEVAENAVVALGAKTGAAVTGGNPAGAAFGAAVGYGVAQIPGGKEAVGAAVGAAYDSTAGNAARAAHGVLDQSDSQVIREFACLASACAPNPAY